jgi:hypothetical protein
MMKGSSSSTRAIGIRNPDAICLGPVGSPGGGRMAYSFTLPAEQGAIMKRVFLFVAVMLFASTWTSSARAQFGMGGFRDPNAEIDQQRSTIKSRLGSYSKPPTSHSRVARPKLSNPASTDAYGRMDLAGHPVPGYPSVRGDLTGSNASRVSRGGANGRGRRAPFRHR